MEYHDISQYDIFGGTHPYCLHELHEKCHLLELQFLSQRTLHPNDGEVIFLVVFCLLIHQTANVLKQLVDVHVHLT